jgi:CheY-like chemotaxis protein
VELPEENFDIVVDRTRIVQAVSNLLSNAAKFTPPDGRIKLSVWRDGKTFHVAVLDSGTGIPPDKLDRVFGLFVQVDRSLETTRGGLGIGLTLVRRITDMHGGRVVARSEGIGQGAEFIISLPVACDAPAQSGSNDSALNVVAAGCRVLVADDSPDSADTLAMMLELAGHEVRTAYDGEAAVREAEAFAPEVIILDIAMPRLNGFEAARKIRASGEATPVLIALTGYGQAQDRRRSAAAGFDHHLVKPVDVDALEAIIMRAKSCGRNDQGATA